MHIVNIMFARQGGGIEQAFLDYGNALSARGHQISPIVYPDSWAEKQLQAQNTSFYTLKNLGEWDIFASRRLAALLEQLRPDVIITHGNRAFTHSIRAAQKHIPVIGTAQNYFTRRYPKADGVLTTTHDLIAHLQKEGVAPGRIFHIPNMITLKGWPKRPERRDPPVIGTLGRFVTKKGFDYYIDALRILKERGIAFKAVLGGAGEQEQALKAQAAKAGLANELAFIGWVENRDAFYESIDIFCLPSLHEPFGIVLLEAFAHGVPVISTDSEGPKDIITHEKDALIFPKANAAAMADAMQKLLAEPAFADRLAASAYARAQNEYASDVVSEKIEKAIEATLKTWL